MAYSTCLNSERKWGTPCVAIQSVQVNRVYGSRLQSLEKQIKDKITHMQAYRLPNLTSETHVYFFSRRGVPVRVYICASLGMVLVMVGREAPAGVASMR